MQTNGTLLDDEWGVFLKEHGFLVGISIDGPAEMHDAYRVDKGGKPTFDRVMAGLDVLKRHEVDWNVLTTIHAVNGDHGREVYTFFRDELGATFIQFIPIIERATEENFAVADAGWGEGVKGRPLYKQEGDLVTHRSVGPEQYGRFMIDVFEEWVRRDIGTVYVQMFDTALANFYGEPGGMCVHAETCGLQLAIEHTGDLYSCDHFVEPDYLLGNIEDKHMLELIVSPQQQKFGQDKFDTLTRYCLDCDVRFACNGGCPKDRFATSPYGEEGQHYLCPSYKAFFHHVSRPMRMMCDLLRAGAAPAELMAIYACGGRAGAAGTTPAPAAAAGSGSAATAPTSLRGPDEEAWGSASERRGAVAEDLGAQHQQQDHHDHGVVAEHELLQPGERPGRAIGVDEVVEDGPDDGERADYDERRDRDGRVRPVEAGLGDRGSCRRGERKVLRIRTGAAPSTSAFPGVTPSIEDPRRHGGILSFLRPFPPLPRGHEQEERPDRDLEPVDRRRGSGLFGSSRPARVPRRG